MEVTATHGVRITACVTYPFPAMTTVWVWSVERIDTASMEWMCMYAPAMMDSLVQKDDVK